MVNSRQIGHASARACKAYYEKIGYTTAKVELTGKFTPYKDMFSEWFETQGYEAGFDMVALNEKELLLVQITTTKPKTHKPFQHFADTFPHTNVVQFVRVKGRVPNIIVKYYPLQKRKVFKV